MTHQKKAVQNQIKAEIFLHIYKIFTMAWDRRQLTQKLSQPVGGSWKNQKLCHSNTLDKIIELLV